MSGTFFSPNLDLHRFQSFTNWALAAWLVIAICQPLTATSPNLEKLHVQFQEYLETHQLDLAQRLLETTRASMPEDMVIQDALHLIHELDAIGCNSAAVKLLDEYWSLIVESPMQAYGWMLRGRLLCLQDDPLAWKAFCKAETMLELQSWPSPDSKAFASLSQRLQTAFQEKRANAERLSCGPMKEEALALYQLLLAQLIDDHVPGYRLSNRDSVYLLRKLLLQTAQLQLEVSQLQGGIKTLESWPSFVHETSELRFDQQDAEKHLLLAKIYIKLGQGEQALDQGNFALQIAEKRVQDYFLTVQAGIIVSQGLALLHQTTQALEILDHTDNIISRLKMDQRSDAENLLLEQKCRLLCQMGRVHQAIEELDSKITGKPGDPSRNEFILLKAKLYEQLGNQDVACATYMDFLEQDSDLQGNLSALQFLLVKTEKLSFQDPLSVRLRSFALQAHKKKLNSSSFVLLCEWSVRHQLGTREDLGKIFGPRLRQIHEPSIRALASYLLFQLEDPSQLNVDSIKESLDYTGPSESVYWLLRALLIEKQGHLQPTRSFDSLCELARLASERNLTLTASELYAKACQLTLTTQDRLLWQKALTLSQEKWAFVQHNESWSVAFVQLVFRTSVLQSQIQTACQLAQQMHERPTFWGLQASLAHCHFLIGAGKKDESFEILRKWLVQSDLPECLQQYGTLELIDLLHRSNCSIQARELIDQTLAKWPSLKERPWVELRRYTVDEYERKVPGSQENLHSLIVRYRDHVASLCAYYLRARQASSESAPSERLRLWEDVERKAAELSRAQVLPSDAQTLVATSNLERARGLEAMHLFPQAIGCLKGLLAQSSITLNSGLDQTSIPLQARLQLAHLLFETLQKNEALEQLDFILRDPCPSLWQSRALLELASFDLRENNPQQCLKHLSDVTAYTTGIQAWRLLLAARAWSMLDDPNRSQIHLHELLLLEKDDALVESAQAEGLWDLYHRAHPGEPLKAKQALSQLSRMSGQPLSKKARELLQHPSYLEAL